MRRGNVEHQTTSKIQSKLGNMPSGVNKALEKVKELNETEQEEEQLVPVSSELKDLILFGKIVEDFQFGGYVFKISTLNNRQQKNLINKLLKLNNEQRILQIKPFTLSEALISINGTSLVELYNGHQNLSDEDKKLELVSELQSSLVEVLFKKYEQLVERSNDLFEPKTDGGMEEQIKN